jgi:hypothetical protein
MRPAYENCMEQHVFLKIAIDNRGTIETVSKFLMPLEVCSRQNIYFNEQNVKVKTIKSLVINNIFNGTARLHAIQK